MTNFINSQFINEHFIKALSCVPDKRSLQDLQIIYYGLHGLEPLACYRDSVLRLFCKQVRYEKYQVNDVLYYTGELATSWYILLSGAVFIAGSMFLPGASFGKRNGGSVRRPSECFVLEASEMIVIDYPEVNSNTKTNLTNINNNSTIDTSFKASSNLNCSGSVSGSGGLITAARVPGVGGSSCGVGRRNSVIDQSSNQMQQHQQQYSSTNAHNLNMEHHILFDDNQIKSINLSGGRPELYQKCNRGSHSSDTSSAYSGSDTMTSVHSSSLDADEVDLSGLVESVVDSDEEDLTESMDSLTVRDTVRECLEKDPSDRTDEDIEILLEFIQKLKAFTNMTLAVRRALCAVMVFAVVEKALTVVMNDGEELDSWSVLINGHVEIEYPNGDTEQLHYGDSFGILPTMDKLYHRGVMRTKCDDCQFVCITQTDYYRIQHQGEENIRKYEEDGKVVMVTELRQNVAENGRRGHVVIRGTTDRLLLQLIEENSLTDPTYIEDFLLTHRTFIDNPIKVACQLIEWFEQNDTVSHSSTDSSSIINSNTLTTPNQHFNDIKNRVTRVVLLWVNNHFTDFESDSKMMAFLEKFENALEKNNMLQQLNLLHIAAQHKARQRQVTLARSSRDENLQFQIIGGYEKGGGIFILNVNKNSKAETFGLKRGDQILEVNGQNFEHVKHNRALELLMSSTHICITVKSNLLGFKDMLLSIESSSSSNDQTDCTSTSGSSVVSRQSYGKRLQQTQLSQSQLFSANNMSNKITSSHDGRMRLSSVELSSPSVANGCSDSSAVAPLLSNEHQMYSSPNKDNNKSSMSQTSLSSSSQKNNNNGSTGSGNGGGGFMTLASKKCFQKALLRLNLLPKNTSLFLDSNIGKTNSNNDVDSQLSANLVLGDMNSAILKSNTSITSNTLSSSATSNENINSTALTATLSSASSLYHSQSNPDLTQLYYEDPRSTDYPEHVLKVYKADQTFKYLLVHKETNAHEVVMLALQEFGIHETSSNFSLCEVSVADGGMIKQRRLPDHLANLAERIGLSSRYYLKTNGSTETLVTDDMTPLLLRDSTIHISQLNPNELAIQLTIQDFFIFRQIESTEYIDHLFKIESFYGTSKLKKFTDLVNHETFWVVTEICSETNLVRRIKIIKKFIKTACHCKEWNNFHSMCAITGGLSHVEVTRLRMTWEKLPKSYKKLLSDLQDIMNPSRNMSKYRQLITAELKKKKPILPFYPIINKDLTFIKDGNDTHIENLINFEKLRMISNEIRNLTNMCNSPYDIMTMFDIKGQQPSSAMIALNQMPGIQSHQSQHQKYQMQQQHQGQATVKRRKKSTAAPNPKKMFEEAQMVRRVKWYLANMKVITDENALHELSLKCEPHGGSAPNTVTIRKRQPSPTLSTTSSTSSTSEGKKGALAGPKFGAASPQAVKKILSLSEQNKTRPHQPRHPGIGLPNIGGGIPAHHHHHALHHQLHQSSVSPSPSPGAHRRMGSSNSAGAVPYASTHSYPLHQSGPTAASSLATVTNVSLTGGPSASSQISGNNIGIPIGGNVHVTRAIHERSHSDTPTPVDLSAESSSVTSLSNLPLRKSIHSGSITSTDSGHSSSVHIDLQSNCPENVSGFYHVASIVHNPPSPILPQRRHSAMQGSSNLSIYNTIPLIPPSSQNALYHNQQQQQQQQQSSPQLQHQQQQQQIQHPQHLTQIQHLQNAAMPSSSSSSSSSVASSSSTSSSSSSSTATTLICSGGGGGGGGISYSQRSVPLSQQQQQLLSSTSSSSLLAHASPIIQQQSSLSIILPPLSPLSIITNSHHNNYLIHSTTTQSSQPLYHHTARQNSNSSVMAPPPPPLPPLLTPHHHHQQQQSRNGPPPPRQPPAYIVATQKARSHRLGRAHSYEGVTSATFMSSALPPTSLPTGGGSSIVQTGGIESNDVDYDENEQVSAV